MCLTFDSNRSVSIAAVGGSAPLSIVPFVSSDELVTGRMLGQVWSKARLELLVPLSRVPLKPCTHKHDKFNPNLPVMLRLAVYHSSCA